MQEEGRRRRGKQKNGNARGVNRFPLVTLAGGSGTDSESEAPSEATPSAAADALVLEHYRAAVLELTRQAGPYPLPRGGCGSLMGRAGRTWRCSGGWRRRRRASGDTRQVQKEGNRRRRK